MYFSDGPRNRSVPFWRYFTDARNGQEVLAERLVGKIADIAGKRTRCPRAVERRRARSAG
jgi:hypothetical protein